MGRNIIFYRTKSGKCPVEEFLESLQPKEAQKVGRDGDTLILTHGYSKKSQKTDAKQIKRAENYRQDYLARKRRPS